MSCFRVCMEELLEMGMIHECADMVMRKVVLLHVNIHIITYQPG